LTAISPDCRLCSYTEVGCTLHNAVPLYQVPSVGLATQIVPGMMAKRKGGYVLNMFYNLFSNRTTGIRNQVDHTTVEILVPSEGPL